MSHTCGKCFKTVDRVCASEAQIEVCPKWNTIPEDERDPEFLATRRKEERALALRVIREKGNSEKIKAFNVIRQIVNGGFNPHAMGYKNEMAAIRGTVDKANEVMVSLDNKYLADFPEILEGTVAVLDVTTNTLPGQEPKAIE